MKTSKRLEGIGEYYFSQKLREIGELNRAGKPVINLGIGSPDLPPHPEVIRVLQEESAKPDVHGYQSYTGSPVLRQAMSDWYQKWYSVNLDPASEILPLIGSKEGILHLCMTWLDKGDEALVPDPGYPTYSSAVRLAGGIVRTYRLSDNNNYEPELEKLGKQKLKKVKLMFLNYPQMPTGRPPSLPLFEKLVAFAREKKILLVHDNPYSFILNEHPLSLLQIPGAMDWAVELNSLSKSHQMAGWRVGMLCGAAEKITQVLRFKSNMDSGMFLPVQLAAARALQSGREWQEEVNQVYRSRREIVFQLLEQLGCTFQRNQAGLFVWARIPEKCKNGFALSDALLYQAGVFITPGGIFGKAGKKYVRVSLCASGEKLEEAIQRIKYSGFQPGDNS